jgi:hypothetical protein
MRWLGGTINERMRQGVFIQLHSLYKYNASPQDATVVLYTAHLAGSAVLLFLLLFI